MINSRTKIAFTTNFCPHYRVKTFELLSKHTNVEFFFYSKGDEWYWLPEHGASDGDFKRTFLPGFQWGGTYITPSLIPLLWSGQYQAFISGIVGRFTLPVTYLVAKLKKKPFILWTGIWSRIQTPAHRLFFPITRHIYRHAEAVVVYGEHVKQYLISEGVQAERIFIAPHAVDNSAYNRVVSAAEKENLRQQLNILPGQKVVLYLGRLEAGKGLTYLLDAFASLPNRDAALVLAGTGSQQSSLEQAARRKGIIDRVRFPGYIPITDTVRYYALAWVYVLPSITTPTFKEPWGLVVNEAFNQGTPVIATDAVGAAAGGLVQDGINGFIVPEQNKKVLANTLHTIIENPQLQQKLGTNARQRIKQWNNEEMVSGFLQAIASVSKKM